MSDGGATVSAESDMEATGAGASATLLHLLLRTDGGPGRSPLHGSRRCSYAVRRRQQRQRGLLRTATTFMPPPGCNKMFVPGFGEASPEAMAAKNLQHFFTFVAVNIVAAQLQSYNPEAYEELMEFISRHSLNDGDKFCGNLMRESSRHQALALRILEVRSAYLKQDFEWENLKKLAFKMVDESNTRLMRDYILETSHIEDEN